MTSSEELDPTVTIRLLVRAGDQDIEQKTKVSNTETMQAPGTGQHSAPMRNATEAGEPGLRDDQEAGHTTPQSRPRSPGRKPRSTKVGPIVAPTPAQPERAGGQKPGSKNNPARKPGAPKKAGAASAAGKLSAAHQPEASALARSYVKPVAIVNDMVDVPEDASPTYRQLYARVMGDFHAGRLIGGDMQPVMEIREAKAMAALRAAQHSNKPARRDVR